MPPTPQPSSNNPANPRAAQLLPDDRLAAVEGSSPVKSSACGEAIKSATLAKYSVVSTLSPSCSSLLRRLCLLGLLHHCCSRQNGEAAPALSTPLCGPALGQPMAASSVMAECSFCSARRCRSCHTVFSVNRRDQRVGCWPYWSSRLTSTSWWCRNSPLPCSIMRSASAVVRAR